MKDALDGTVLTSLDLRDLKRRYGYPLPGHPPLRPARPLPAGLPAGRRRPADQPARHRVREHRIGARSVTLADGATHAARLVIAADGLHSAPAPALVGDEPVNSAYVAYRGAVPIEKVRENNISETDVVVYVGPRCHFVQYPLRGGDMFNQVAVFESAKARAGEEDWGTPDELDAAFAHTTENVQRGLPLMGRDRWWRMFDRDPIKTWVYGRIALLGDAAHPPLQYIAQGAIMAIEDGYVLAEHLAANPDRRTARPPPTRPSAPSTAAGWSPPPAPGEALAPGRREARAPQRDPPRPRHLRLLLHRLALLDHGPYPGPGAGNVQANPECDAGHGQLVKPTRRCARSHCDDNADRRETMT